MTETNQVAICPIEPISNCQNVPYGFGLINPHTGFPINPAVADQRFIDAIMKMEGEKFKAQLDMEKQRLDFIYKRDLEALKAENRIRLEEKQSEIITKRIEGMQARTEERENAAYAIFKDSESRLRLETKYPNRKTNYSEPVINSADMRAYRICDMEMHKTVFFVVEGDNLTEKIILARDDINPRAFERCLSKRGLAVTVGRERRKLVVELLLSYLVDEAIVVELPTTVGWSKTNTGWIFAETDTETIEGVVRERYEIK